MGALRDPMASAAAVQRFSADGVRFARVDHADPHGRCRSKELPIDRLAMATEGLGYCAASLVEGLDGEPLMGEAFPGGQGFPDLHAIGDLATARSRSLAAGHALAAGRPRRARRHAVAALHARRAAPRDGAPRESRPARDGGVRARVLGRCASAKAARSSTTRRSGHGLQDRGPRRPDRPRAAHPRGAGRVGLGVTTALREFSPGQCRSTWRTPTRWTAADNAFLLEEIVKEDGGGRGAPGDVHGEAAHRAPRAPAITCTPRSGVETTTPSTRAAEASATTLAFAGGPDRPRGRV